MSRSRRIYRKKILSLIPYSIFVFIPIFLILVLIGFFNRDSDSKTKIISPVTTSGGMKAITNVLPDIITGNKITTENIEEIVAKNLKGEKGTYSIVYKNLKNGDEYYKNETNEYESASLYKLFVMAKTYEELENGSISKNTILKDTVERLNARFDIASEEAEMTEGEFTMTIDTALDQMITISHNYAALLLTTKLKTSEIKDFIKANGFIHTNFTAPPRTTPEDILLFYEKLYKKELVSQSASDEMLALLKKQELNDRIPKYLPKEVQVAHKTGELGGVKHDAGIVFTKEGDYILIFMTDTNAPQHAAEVQAKISGEIFELSQ